MNTPDIEPLQRLTRDLKTAAATLTTAEVRFLVDHYYQIQEDRKRSANQVRAGAEAGEPHAVILWLGENTARLENNIKSALDAYSTSHPVGAWSKSIVGIGPVIAAGLLAHIDITKAPTVGHIWRFAGLDPTVSWGKGERRPWNARLKVLCWKIGESFVKVSGKDEDVYGKLYLHRKALEGATNDASGYADQAAAILKSKRFGDDTKAKSFYLNGQLPPGHLHARAKRWAVKLFLSHWHAVAYRHHFGTLPPKPYVLTHLGHVDEIQVPNWPW